VIYREKPAFDAANFLAVAGLGRTIVQFKPKQHFFSQGEAADSIFYLQKGRAKVTVVSPTGKEAASRSFPLVNSWEKSHWLHCPGVAWLRLSPSHPALR